MTTPTTITVEDLISHMESVRNMIANPSARSSDESDATLYGRLTMIEIIAHTASVPLAREDRARISAEINANDGLIKTFTETGSFSS